jgi:hypothetical protein
MYIFTTAKLSKAKVPKNNRKNIIMHLAVCTAEQQKVLRADEEGDRCFLF